jgi:hypothetical protein
MSTGGLEGFWNVSITDWPKAIRDSREAYICRSCRHPERSRNRRKCNQQFRSQAC